MQQLLLPTYPLIHTLTLKHTYAYSKAKTTTVRNSKSICCGKTGETGKKPTLKQFYFNCRFSYTRFLIFASLLATFCHSLACSTVRPFLVLLSVLLLHFHFSVGRSCFQLRTHTFIAFS